jgi:hypothetical protein
MLLENICLHMGLGASVGRFDFLAGRLSVLFAMLALGLVTPRLSFAQG